MTRVMITPDIGHRSCSSITGYEGETRARATEGRATERWRQSAVRAFVRSPCVVSLLVSLLVCLGLLGLRQAGGFEALELAAYDWFLRLRPEAPADPRIVFITVTEQDIHQYHWPLSDATLARALDLLAEYQPRAIGLDIYRDIPVERGHTEFETTWRNHANIIAVTKVGALETLVPPPQVL